jgi:amidophosphoribosyltransferase
MVVIDGNGLRSTKPFPPVRPARCVFEYVYFAKPDSVLFGSSVYETRKALGRELAREQPAPTADLVIAVPDSGVPAAIGFSQVSGIPYDVGLIRSHYVGRCCGARRWSWWTTPSSAARPHGRSSR